MNHDILMSYNMIVNALTIDVEDYFQVHALSNVIKYEDWDHLTSHVEKNTYKILDILDSTVCGQPTTRIKRNGCQLSTDGAFGDKETVKSNQSGKSCLPRRWEPSYRGLTRNNDEPSAISHELGCQGNPKATFFILGWIAKRYPGLAKEIQSRDHEIASHGYAHKVIYNQTPAEFREDIRSSKAILEELTGNEVIGYRAPTYSITKKTLWALNILAEEGYKYDSSIFPIRHDYYGMSSAPRFPFLWNLNGDNPRIEKLDQPSNSTMPLPSRDSSTQLLRRRRIPVHHFHPESDEKKKSNKSCLPRKEERLYRGKSCLTKTVSSNQAMLIEFPMSTVRLLGRNFPCSGGGYFQLFPYPIIRLGLERINREGKPFIFYLHPWELDPNIPRVDNLSALSRFRTYVNLNKTESRFKKLISEYKFSTIKSFLTPN